MLFGVAVSIALGSGGGDAIDRVQADRVRIQSHLARVESQLRERDASELSPQLRRARATNLDRLHEYWRAGRFPQNDERMGERIPVFIDPNGTACAVGHLVIESGAMQVAQEIRAFENTAYLDQMRHPALDGWIAQSGLTKAECAQIQPTYCGCGDESMPVCGVDGKTYANACYAETCAMVEIAYEGVCQSDGTTGWPPAGTGPDTDDGATTTGASTGDGGESTGVEPPATTTAMTTTPSESSDDSATTDDAEVDNDVRGRGCRIGSPPLAAPWLLLLGLVPRRRR